MIDPSDLRKAATLAASVSQVGVMSLIGAGLGWVVDTRIGTLPLFLVAGVTSGFGLGLWMLFRTLSQVDHGGPPDRTS